MQYIFTNNYLSRFFNISDLDVKKYLLTHTHTHTHTHSLARVDNHKFNNIKALPLVKTRGLHAFLPFGRESASRVPASASLGPGYASLGLGYASLGLGSAPRGLGYASLGLGYASLGLGYAPLGRGYASRGRESLLLSTLFLTIKMINNINY
jgi:hypothetical protein